VPDSSATGALAAGSYAFKAVYTPAAGSSYNGDTATCEPFTVGVSGTHLSTKVLDAANKDVTSSSVPLGTVVHDTATLTPDTSGFSLAGTVVYTFYRGGDCTTGTADASPETVTVSAAGVVPDSSTTGPLAIGDY